jgi:hypothetical protein
MREEGHGKSTTGSSTPDFGSLRLRTGRIPRFCMNCLVVSGETGSNMSLKDHIPDAKILADFRASLDPQVRQAFELHHRRLRNLVMIYTAQLHLDGFLASRRFKEAQYRRVWRCYEVQTEENLSLNVLRDCLAETQENKQKFRKLKERTYFMSRFSLQNKMTNCANKFEVDSAEFLDCEWTSYSKIYRRLTSYWPEKLAKITDKM